MPMPYHAACCGTAAVTVVLPRTFLFVSKRKKWRTLGVYSMYFCMCLGMRGMPAMKKTTLRISNASLF